MDRDTLVNKAYWENIVMNTRWSKTVQHLNATHNLHNNCDRRHNSKKFPGIMKKTMEQNFIDFWLRTIRDRTKEKKLDLYARTKTSFDQHQYLRLPSFRDRQRISKLLCSDHQLEIERGRHTKTPRDERKCTTCDLETIENEGHFLMECPAYSDLRTSIFDNDGRFTRLEDLLDKTTPADLTKFLKLALNLRKNRYQVSEISMCFLKMKISTATNNEERPPKAQTQLHSSPLPNNRLGLKIRWGRKKKD